MPDETEPNPIEGQDLEPAHHKREHHKHGHKHDKPEAEDPKPEDESETPDPQPFPTAPKAMTNPSGPVTHPPVEEESDESKEAKSGD